MGRKHGTTSEEHSYARQGKICIEDPILTEVEVRNALISLKKGKASGPDKNLSKWCAAIDLEGQKMLLIPQRERQQIEGELILCLKDENEFVKLLTERFNKIMNGEIHKGWFNSRINLIPKKKKKKKQLKVQEFRPM